MQRYNLYRMFSVGVHLCKLGQIAYQYQLETIAASPFAYLYYPLKVCTIFVKKKYILLSV